MKNQKMLVLRRVWEISRPYHKYMHVILAFMSAQMIISAIQPIFLGRVVTGIQDKNSSLVWASICIWLGIAVTRPLIGLVREWFDQTRFDYEFPRYLSRISADKYFGISMGQHHSGHSIIKRHIMTKGETGIYGLVNMTTYEILPIMLGIIIPLGLLMWHSPLLGSVVLGVMAVYTTYTLQYNLRAIPKIRALDTLHNRLGKRHGELIHNVDTVIMNAQEERVKNDLDRDNVTKSDKGLAVWLPYIYWFYGGQGLIVSAKVLCVGFCAYLTLHGDVTTGMFVTMSAWITQSLDILTNISNLQRNFARNFAPIRKYFAFLDYKTDIVMPANPVPLGKVHGDIEFRNVSFAYNARVDEDALNDDKADAKAIGTGGENNGDGDDEDESEGDEEKKQFTALRNVSLKIEAGKRYAFVGPSGAGKSTIVGLILRSFDPQSGHVLVDGVDVRMLDFHELRRNIGLVPQQVAMFDGTVRENVLFGMNGDASKVTDVEIDKVAKLSRMSEFRDQLEKGWNTFIGERGIKLSGGQCQRVGIARALVKDPAILIFDEATSSLDTVNEAKIRESIVEASKGKTTIVIAHRLATVMDADKIFVMNDGEIVGEGTHEELLRANTAYQELVKNQVIVPEVK